MIIIDNGNERIYNSNQLNKRLECKICITSCVREEIGMAENGRRASVSEAIFEELKKRIIAGEWKPGERLPSESKLCELTGASRVSVRAAIQKLSSLGLVESRQGGGTNVCMMSGEQHLNSVLPYFTLARPDRVSMFEFRRIIEVEGAALAAQRADAQQIQAMYTATRKMAEAGSAEEITRHDLEFHYLIMQGSRNSILVKVFEILQDTYLSLLHENVTRLGARGAAHHQMIAQAIESRDPELARLLMERHLNDTIQAMEESGPEDGAADAD